MLWHCLAAGGTGNTVRRKGRMDSTKYQRMLEANVQWPVAIGDYPLASLL